LEKTVLMTCLKSWRYEGAGAPIATRRDVHEESAPLPGLPMVRPAWSASQATDESADRDERPAIDDQ
jgi:hypothetical protein